MLNGAEKLWHLPQPDFEHGAKNLTTVGLRRALRILGPSISNMLFQSFLPPGMEDIKEDLTRQANSAFTDPFLRTSLNLLLPNLYFFPWGVHLRASRAPEQCDSYARDNTLAALSLISLGATNALPLCLLESMEDKHSYPQTPTVKLLGGHRLFVKEDESNLWSIILMTALKRKGWSSPLLDNQEYWQQKWAEVKNHTEDGLYHSPVGTASYWLDTFIFQRPDVITNVQGLFTMAALGFEKNDKVTQQAIANYRGLTHPSGRLQLSKNVPYLDLSSLMADGLSTLIYDEPLLKDEIAQKTYQMQPRAHFGMKVVTKEDGHYPDQDEFCDPCLPGHYHRGGSFFFVNALARLSAEAHSYLFNPSTWHQELWSLNATDKTESTQTDRGSTFPIYNLRREGYSANSIAYAAARYALRNEVPDSLVRTNLIELLERERGLTEVELAVMRYWSQHQSGY